jgi:hypothetical protein
MRTESVAPATTPDALVPNAQLCRELGITRMTLHRWERDQSIGLPPPIKIRGRNFRSRAEIEAFKARLWRDAIKRRAKKGD